MAKKLTAKEIEYNKNIKRIKSKIKAMESKSLYNPNDIEINLELITPTKKAKAQQKRAETLQGLKESGIIPKSYNFNQAYSKLKKLGISQININGKETNIQDIEDLKNQQKAINKKINDVKSLTNKKIEQNYFSVNAKTGEVDTYEEYKKKQRAKRKEAKIIIENARDRVKNAPDEVKDIIEQKIIEMGEVETAELLQELAMKDSFYIDPELYKKLKELGTEQRNVYETLVGLGMKKEEALKTLESYAEE